jgi:TRAP-type mannitol/chloroaromatic compound transport system substrate-binding protein
MDSWLTIGQEDAKALEFFREQGNEVIELSPEVQYEAREAGLKWAEEIATENDWFKRVLESQKEFADLWKDSNRYRNVKVRQ